MSTNDSFLISEYDDEVRVLKRQLNDALCTIRELREARPVEMDGIPSNNGDEDGTDNQPAQ